MICFFVLLYFAAFESHTYTCCCASYNWFAWVRSAWVVALCRLSFCLDRAVSLISWRIGGSIRKRRYDTAQRTSFKIYILAAPDRCSRRHVVIRRTRRGGTCRERASGREKVEVESENKSQARQREGKPPPSSGRINTSCDEDVFFHFLVQFSSRRLGYGRTRT